MKKILFLVAASALMVACGQKGKTADAANGGDSAVAVDSLVYEGEIPGADGTITMRLALAKDSTVGFTLAEHYSKGDTTFTSTGKFENISGKGGEGYKCTVAPNDVRYFLLKDSTTLTYVNDSTLVPAKTELSYDLKKK